MKDFTAEQLHLVATIEDLLDGLPENDALEILHAVAMRLP